jgi:hypothetical protein
MANRQWHLETVVGKVGLMDAYQALDTQHATHSTLRNKDHREKRSMNHDLSYPEATVKKLVADYGATVQELIAAHVPSVVRSSY